MKLHHRRGQSLIEYSFIAMLVIMGIVAMGPYVLRSINAHFKIWDQEIQDSHNEHLNDLPDFIGAPPVGGGEGEGDPVDGNPNSN